MRIRSIVVASLIAGLVLPVVPAMAANKPVVINDTKGDANALNDQGFTCITEDPDICLPANKGVSTAPLSSNAHDIVSATLSTQFITKRQGTRKVQVPTNVIVVLQLGGAPAAGSMYRVTGQYGSCATFFVQYSVSLDGVKGGSIRTCDPAATLGTVTNPLPTTKVSGNKITFTIPLTLLAKLPVPLKIGTVVSTLGAHVRLYLGTSATGGVTVPQMDVIETTLKFTVGK